MMTWGGMAAVGIGAAIGAWARWLLSVWMNALVPQLPLGTLAANLVGGFFAGFALEFFRVGAALPPEWRLFAVTGFLGGLTTFSTFSAESLSLVSSGQWGWALGHTLIHVLGCLAAAGLGAAVFRMLLA